MLPPAGGQHLPVEHHGHDRQQRDGEPPRHASQRGPQLRVDGGELPGLGGKSGGVGRLPHGRDPYFPCAARDARGGEHLVPPALDHGVALPREQRLVQVQAVRLEHHGVRRDLVPAGEQQDVVQHDLLEGDPNGGTVAEHPRGVPAQQGDPVQLPLGGVLLDEADHHVAHRGQAEQQVQPPAQCDDDRRAQPQHQVEEGEHVGADDGPHAAGRGAGGRVGQSEGDPLGNGVRAETLADEDAVVDSGRLGRRALRPLGHGSPRVGTATPFSL